MKSAYKYKIDTDSFFDVSLFSYLIFFLLDGSQDSVLIKIGRWGATGLLLLSGFFLLVGVIHNFRMSMCFVWYSVFCIYALTSSFWAQDTGAVFELFITFLRIALVIFFVSIRIRNDDDVRRILDMFKYSVIIRVIVVFILMIEEVSSTGIFQYRFGDVVGYNSNSTAVYCVFALLIAIDETHNRGKDKKTYITAIALVLTILLSGSKNGILGVFIGLSLYLLFNNRGTKKIQALVAISIILFIGYEAITTIPSLYISIGFRFEQMFDTFKGETSGTSTIERMSLIEKGVTVWKNNKLIGVGLNNFSVAQNGASIYGGVYAHCNYIELLADLGIVGILIYYIYPVLICFKYRTFNSTMRLLKILTIVEMIFDIAMVSYNDIFIVLILSLAYFTQLNQNLKVNVGSE